MGFAREIVRIGALSALALCVACDPGTPLATEGEHVSSLPPGAAHFTQWKLYDPADPNAPALIVPEGEAYRLDPDWQPATIEYSYRYGHVGTNEGQQRIERVGSDYVTEGQVIPQTEIRALLAAVNNLHPTQGHLHYASESGFSSWIVKLTGVGGELITISSTGVGTPGSAPWNVLYNGRWYAQYDGSIAKPLLKLTKPGPDSRGAWTTYSRPSDPAHRYVSVFAIPTDTNHLGMDFPILPPPREINVALATNVAATDLLSDHVLLAANYKGEIDINDTLAGPRVGEMILLGEMTHNSKRYRYTVGLPFAVEDQVLTHWDLDRAKLDNLRKTVAELPLTQRVLEADPEAVINLWFSSKSLIQLSKNIRPEPFYSDQEPPSYEISISPCGDVPGGTVPTDGEVLQGFSFNSNLRQKFRFETAEFVLLKGRVVAAHLYLAPNDTDFSKGAALKALTPDEFNTGDTRPFRWISLAADETRLYFVFPRNSTSDEKRVYTRILETLPGNLVIVRLNERDLQNATLAVTDQGKLKVVACE